MKKCMQFYKKNQVKITMAIFIIMSIFVAILNIVRLFDINYWGDEAFSVKLAKMNISTLIQATADDVHPPFFYLVIRMTYLIFGDTGVAYHLAAVIPVLLMIVFSMTVIRKKYGKKISLFFILLGTFSTECLIFNVEIRMYSWAYFFVTLCFWYGSEIVQDKNNIKSKLNWSLMTAFGLLAAYTHYYALISVAFIMATVYIMAIVNNKKNLKKCIISLLICVALYMPWLNVLMQSFQRSSSDDGWWSEYMPSLQTSLKYIFDSGNYDTVILCMTILLGLWCLIMVYKKDKKAISIKKSSFVSDIFYKFIIMIIAIFWYTSCGTQFIGVDKTVVSI